MRQYRISTEKKIEEEAENRFQNYLKDKTSYYNELENYSGTHKAMPLHLFEPENVQQLEELVSEAHRCGQKLRPVGRFLSPNGIASCGAGMVSLSGCDKIIGVDKEEKANNSRGWRSRFRCSRCIGPSQLDPSKLLIYQRATNRWLDTGWRSRHGARLSTVDEMITRLKVITPARGVLELSENDDCMEDRDMFKMVRCGLGSLGIVSEVTLQCTDSHFLRETTSFSSLQNLKKNM